jgi:glycosyltransferase involved in cell wall biosynthesis
MACGTPLVVTAFALGGIAARDDRDLLVATDAAHFAAQTIRMLRDAALRERLAQSARRLVERDHSWERCVADLEALYERAIRP